MHAAERDQPDVQAERAAFQAEVAALDPERLVFVDESGVLTCPQGTRSVYMGRLSARAPEGQRARGSAPACRWQRLTVLGALGCEGVAAAMTIAATTDTAIFLAFVDKVLIPELRQSRPDAIVVTDNLYLLPLIVTCDEGLWGSKKHDSWEIACGREGWNGGDFLASGLGCGASSARGTAGGRRSLGTALAGDCGDLWAE